MSEYALEYALEANPDADIPVLTVVGDSSCGARQSPSRSPTISRTSRNSHSRSSIARELAANAGGDADLETIVELGHPVRPIINCADDYETVVIGMHGGTVSERLFVGNVAERVVRRSPVPVVVVR